MSKVKIQGNASGTGIFTIAAPATNTDRTITLPDVDAALMTSSGGTFTGNIVVTKDGSSDNRFVQITDTGASGTRWDLINRYGNTAGAFAIYDHTNSRGALEITPASHIKMAYQPAFYAGYSSSSSVTVNDATQMPVADLTKFNRGNCYSTSNGRFTAPVAGVYLFYFNYLYSSSGAIQMMINGSSYNFSDTILSYSSSTSVESKPFTVSAYLNVNDYVYPAARNGNQTVYLWHSSWGGHLLG